MVPNETSEYDADVIPRSASTPRLVCDDDSIVSVHQFIAYWKQLAHLFSNYNLFLKEC